MTGGVCRGKCESPNFPLPKRKSLSKAYTRPKYDDRKKFLEGWKRCQACHLYMQTDLIWCPCCGWRLAVSRRNPRAVLKWRERYKDTTQLDIPRLSTKQDILNNMTFWNKVIAK